MIRLESFRISLLGLLGSLLVFSAACERDKVRPEQQQGAPSASVVSIANAFGTCDDVAQCEKECEQGAADRCRRLGVTYQMGAGVDKDEARATTYFARACAMKNAPACLSAGQMYEFAHGVAKDDAKAASFYEQACTIGYSAGCYNLGVMYENGRGVPKDVDKAIAMYAVPCKEGAKVACAKVEELKRTQTPPTLPPFVDASAIH
jgi:TPR repeat protein